MYEDENNYEDEEMLDQELDQGDMWNIVSLFFAKFGLVKQQLKSFDQFLGQKLDSILENLGDIQMKSNDIIAKQSEDNYESNSRILVKFSDSKFIRPQLTEQGERDKRLLPQTARLRGLSYNVVVKAQLDFYVLTEGDSGLEESHTDDNLVIAEVPSMVRSQFCHLHTSQDPGQNNECECDPGGYFIVNGSEKVIIGQEHMVINKPIIFTQASMVKYDLCAQVRSQPAKFGEISQPFDLYLCTPSQKDPLPRIHCKLAKMEKTVPLFILFRAINVISDKEIIEHICYDPEDTEFIDMLRPCITEAQTFRGYESSLDFIGKRCSIAGEEKSRRLQKAKEMIDRILLPHLGEKGCETSKKAYFIGYMAHNLILTALGRRDPDDRDHYSNKRLDLAGPLIGQLFAGLFLKMKDSIQKHLKQKLKADPKAEEVAKLVKQSIRDPSSITSGLEYSMGTGNWNAERKSVTKVGVSQMLNRLTFLSTLSNLRRTNTPIGRDGKLTGPRHLHNTHWGYICPVETPEGQACGLIKNLSLTTIVTIDRPDVENIRGILEDTGLISIDSVTTNQIKDYAKVFLNGSWYGVHHDAGLLIHRLRAARRQGQFHPDVSLIHNIADKEVFIWSDSGRVTRPLLIVEDKKPLLKKSRIHDYEYWKDLLSTGVVEYLDIDEEETMMISLSIDNFRNRKSDEIMPNYTHCEIHPALIFGVAGSIIPFPDHNQSPRNTYQCAMGKQAIGLYATNFMMRMDSSAHVLWYPQKPLVITNSMNYIHFKSLPAGINCCVAIGCYTGYNQEDSLMLNSGSIDRGLFRSFFFRTYKDQADEGDVFTIPEKDTCKGIRNSNYTRLGPDGLAIIGTRVVGDDIVIGKVSPDAPTKSDAREKKDSSTPIRHMETGIVDLVMRSKGKKGREVVKVRTRQMRRPEIGDKFSSRHGQKGVCGMTYRHEDMPFTREGIVPDIIMNPHAIPSRMTIGQLIENLLGKTSALEGHEGDATPFSQLTVEDIGNQLQRLGYERYGNETLYNGRTGKRLKAKIFFGPTYYQRLKHMVADKAHARSHGPVTMLLRQPVEGRSRNGGLRFGEMERDCLIAHGVSAMLRDRLLENSDRYQVSVCENCGMIAINKDGGDAACTVCKENAKVSKVELPYAFKLVIQELMAMCILPKLRLTD